MNIINVSEKHPFRILTGGFAAAAFAALLAFSSIEKRSPPLSASAFCFSVCVIPLTIFCGCRWPVQKPEWSWYAWVLVYLLSLLFFAAGIVCLIGHFGWGAASIAGLSALILFQIAVVPHAKQYLKETRGSK